MKDQKDIAGFAMQAVLKEKFDDLARGVVTIDYKTSKEVADMRDDVKELVRAVNGLVDEIDVPKATEAPEEGSKVRTNDEIYKVALATYKLADALPKGNSKKANDSISINLRGDSKKTLLIVGGICLLVGFTLGAVVGSF